MPDLDDSTWPLIPVQNRWFQHGFDYDGTALVQTAIDAFQAQKILNEGELPDVVLLDIMMPRLSGYDFCRLIREKYSLSELPVVMLTAKNQLLDLVAGYESGANDYVTKPFDSRELLARVGTLIALKKAAGAQEKLTTLQKEIEIARRMQQSILPDKVPTIPGVAIAANYSPMEQVGGDFYDFHYRSEKKAGCICCRCVRSWHSCCFHRGHD